MLEPGRGFTVWPDEKHGWMVSTKQEGNAYRIFYGADPAETIVRALANGPQLQQGDDFMGDEVWQSRKAPKDGLDDFPTQPWASRAFFHHVLQHKVKEGEVIWECAANRGYMVRVLQEFFPTVIGTDFHDYGVGFPVVDFIDGPSPADYGQKVDWVVTNPPYNKALEFALRGLEVAERGVALLLRTQWLEGDARYEKLFSKHPPTYICQYVERVGFDHGQVTPKGARQVPYCWFVWDKTSDLKWPRVRWIPPSKKVLEKDTDYV